MKRPTIYELESELRQIDAPALVLVGDEDEPCLEPGLFMKHAMPRSGLAIFPQSGHTINLEEPALFNQTILDFLTAVEADRWPRRGE
jgi:pimeloyl-ACP methyl ester carboxylesterase